MEDQVKDPVHCFRCGAFIPEDAEHCPGCGMPVMRVRSSPDSSWRPASETATAEGPGHSRAAAGVADRVLYAGFWLRAVAYTVDTLVLGLLTAPILFFVLPRGPQLWQQIGKLPPSELFNMANPEVRSVMTVALPVFLIVGWLYYALCESSPWQATPGKRLLGLIVTNQNGQPIGFGRASARFFGKLLSGQLFGFGYILAGFTRRKQALHDFIARCLVVRR